MDRPRQSPQHKQAFGSILIAILMETYTNKVPKTPNKAYVQALCQQLGFLACGISQARFLHEEVKGMEKWIAQGNHGSMDYLARNMDKRLDPTKLVPGAKTVVSVLYNYYPKKDIFANKKLKIARYAYGEDYHQVMKDKLHQLLHALRDAWGDIAGRPFVDSAPVHERAWAKNSGLGWIGKNTLLLNKQVGSFFFIGNLIIDIALEPDAPTSNHCGTCRRCIDACPTQALSDNGTLNARRCLSYINIESKNSPTEALATVLPTQKKDEQHWVFGCDICQEVCPWNRFAIPHTEPRFDPNTALMDWVNKPTNASFEQLAHQSPLQRAGRKKLQQIIAFYQ